MLCLGSIRVPGFGHRYGFETVHIYFLVTSFLHLQMLNIDKFQSIDSLRLANAIIDIYVLETHARDCLKIVSQMGRGYCLLCSEG